ncbi:MAG: DNA translocase FtsK, partial [Moorella sp. (in: firmicutes)]
GEAEDELFPAAVRVILETGQASISMLQRRLRIGYTRAARLMDMMEARGFVGGHEGTKARAILTSWEEYEELFGNKEG